MNGQSNVFLQGHCMPYKTHCKIYMEESEESSEEDVVPKKKQKITTHLTTLNPQDFKDANDPLKDAIQIKFGKIWKLDTYPDVADEIEKLKYGKEARIIYNKWLLNPETLSGNRKFAVFIHLELELDGSTPDHEFGDCLLTSVSKRKEGWKCTFMNKKGSDSYVHHVAMAAMIQTGQIYTSTALKKVSTSKKEKKGALTISHLCGNGACVRPIHLYLEKKTVNNERTHCHFIMWRSASKVDSNTVRRLCPHNPPCFINKYNGINSAYY